MDPLCPSAPPVADGSRIFGVVGGDPEERRVAYLTEPIPLTGEVAASLGSVHPGEVLRSASSCGGCACRHFDGERCTLASRITQLLPTVVDRPPPCAIRRSCRWWLQEGVAACLRCPQVVSASLGTDPRMVEAASPP